MKIRMLGVAALAALAVSGLFAPTASAERMQEFAACGPFPPEEEAYLKDPSRTMQEIKEAWEINKERYCATAVVPLAEADDIAYFVSACLESGMPHFTKAEAEACIAEWESQRGRTTGLRHKKGKRRHQKPRRHSDEAKRQPQAGIALARAFDAR
jgi:hypothetical protein